MLLFCKGKVLDYTGINNIHTDMIYTDIGNTWVKAVTKSGADWVEVFRERIIKEDKITEWVATLHPDSKMVAVSVRQDIQDLISSKDSNNIIEWIDTKTISDFDMDYETPKTLGIDRFLACIGACTVTSNDVVVIDAGSACTIDMMSAARTYRGGVIMPGLSLLHSVMETGTPELPTVSREIPDQFPGKSTEACIQWGINGTFIHAVRSFLNQYAEMYGEFDVFVTGGDANWIYELLSSEYSLKLRRNIIFDGMVELQRILKRN